MPHTPEEVGRRLQAALDMFDDGLELYRARMAREHPNASREDIDALVQRWLLTRPGAEYGDAVGRPRPVTGSGG